MTPSFIHKKNRYIIPAACGLAIFILGVFFQLKFNIVSNVTTFYIQNDTGVTLKEVRIICVSNDIEFTTIFKKISADENIEFKFVPLGTTLSYRINALRVDGKETPFQADYVVNGADTYYLSLK